ncbi:hypothetical protein QL285_091448 [Trifolium repens]|nr:hypothetical protein QL285_091448 [Trifolium repens]
MRPTHVATFDHYEKVDIPLIHSLFFFLFPFYQLKFHFEHSFNKNLTCEKISINYSEGPTYQLPWTRNFHMKELEIFNYIHSGQTSHYSSKPPKFLQHTLYNLSNTDYQIQEA